MEIARVGVVGAGQMGNGIAQVAATAGYQVLLQDISDAALDKGLKTIEKHLGRMVAKDKISADDAAAAQGRVARATDVAAMEGCDLII